MNRVLMSWAVVGTGSNRNYSFTAPGFMTTRAANLLVRQ